MSSLIYLKVIYSVYTVISPFTATSIWFLTNRYIVNLDIGDLQNSGCNRGRLRSWWKNIPCPMSIHYFKCVIGYINQFILSLVDIYIYLYLYIYIGYHGFVWWNVLFYVIKFHGLSDHCVCSLINNFGPCSAPKCEILWNDWLYVSLHPHDIPNIHPYYFSLHLIA
jgi:hypothetical protein